MAEIYAVDGGGKFCLGLASPVKYADGHNSVTLPVLFANAWCHIHSAVLRLADDDPMVQLEAPHVVGDPFSRHPLTLMG